MIEIYQYRGPEDGFEFQARFNNDGTVDGSTVLAGMIRNWLTTVSVDYVEYNTAIDVGLEHRYSNAAFQTNRS